MSHDRENLAGSSKQPIAIVGMACRFPGGATSPSKLWDLCTSGRNAWSTFPRDRFDGNSLYDTDPEKIGRVRYFLPVVPTASQPLPYYELPGYIPEQVITFAQKIVNLEILSGRTASRTRRLLSRSRCCKIRCWLLQPPSRGRQCSLVPQSSSPGKTTAPDACSLG